MGDSKQDKKKITLALQGGGSHGAFTWGVLDRLLDEQDLHIEGISGTSAGAINAAITATGLVEGDPPKAQKLLAEFWESISAKPSIFNPASLAEPSSLEQNKQQFFSFWRDLYTQIFSPYDLNPLNYNPLKDLLENTVDFPKIRASKQVKIYVSATNIETNELKIFENEELCIEALLASSCLPTVQQAVKWKGQYFWDGGFMGNPILEPLIYSCNAQDLLIVPINPFIRKGVPKTAREIIDRMNEINFNSSLMHEIKGIFNIRKLSSGDNPFTRLRLHCIHDGKFMVKFAASTKYDTNWSFLCKLRDKGREAADHWIKENFQHLGFKTTIDLSSWSL